MIFTLNLAQSFDFVFPWDEKKGIILYSIFGWKSRTEFSLDFGFFAIKSTASTALLGPVIKEREGRFHISFTLIYIMVCIYRLSPPFRVPIKLSYFPKSYWLHLHTLRVSFKTCFETVKQERMHVCQNIHFRITKNFICKVSKY